MRKVPTVPRIIALRMIPCSSYSDIISPNKDCNKESNFNENDLQVVSNTLLKCKKCLQVEVSLFLASLRFEYELLKLQNAFYSDSISFLDQRYVQIHNSNNNTKKINIISKPTN